MENNETTSAIEGKIWHGPELGDLEARVRPWKSLGHYFLQKLNDNSQTTILTDFASERQWTGGEFRDKVLAVACALVDEHNFQPGTMVCMSYDNSDHLIILAVAVIIAGGSLATSYHKDPYAELLYLAKKVEPGFLFCHAENLNWTLKLEHDLPGGHKVIGIAMDGVDPNDKNSFAYLLQYDYKKRSQAYANNLLPVACRRGLEQEVALVTMSSGTTGKPKAVSQSHYNCIADLLGTSKSVGMFSFTCCASLDYVSGRLIIFGAINRGYNAVILKEFEPQLYLQALEKYKCLIIYLGAASFYNLITHPDIDKYDLSNLRSVFPMGAKITYQRELAQFLGKHPHIKEVRQGYGASEFGGAAMKYMRPEEYLHDANNSGRLFPGFKAKVLHPNGSGQLLGPNQEGLLLIKGPTLFPGYYDKQQARTNAKVNSQTATNNNTIESQPAEVNPFVWDSSVFDAEGYYITGDLGYFNDQEDLFIVGRQKELMSCRGAKKVLPQEIEEVIERHPAVRKVCVLGIPNKREPTLQCPRAFVVLKSEYYNETNAEQLKLRPKLDLHNRLLEEKLMQEVLVHSGEHTLLTGITRERRHMLAEDLMVFVNERVGWEKHLTGGLVLLDDIPTSRATGKMNKNYLRALTLTQIEVYGDRSS